MSDFRFFSCVCEWDLGCLGFEICQRGYAGLRIRDSKFAAGGFSCLRPGVPQKPCLDRELWKQKTEIPKA